MRRVRRGGQGRMRRVRRGSQGRMRRVRRGGRTRRGGLACGFQSAICNQQSACTQEDSPADCTWAHAQSDAISMQSEDSRLRIARGLRRIGVSRNQTQSACTRLRIARGLRRIGVPRVALKRDHRVRVGEAVLVHRRQVACLVGVERARRRSGGDQAEIRRRSGGEIRR